MKKVLWVSRHNMTDGQRSDLERIYGEIELIQLDATVQEVGMLTAYAADVYAVVLPLQLLAELRKSTAAEIIQPVSGRVRTEGTVFNQASGKYESEYVFQHLYWQRIVRLELETENLIEQE